jgi:dTDP-4-amino-4,6-dideoxygalactose transaminase
MIPFANPRAQYMSRKEEIDTAVRGVLEGGWYILGEEVKEFEREFASYIDVAHAVGVGSGTDALVLALAALGIGRGDEVITVSHTAVATVAAIERSGATPVLADIDASTFTMDPEELRRLISPRTRAVIPVHLYGHPADMDAILRVSIDAGLRVIEDCAQAHGAAIRGKKVGSFGDMACFSFYPTKNLGAVGDGGAVVTDDEELAQRARLIREYGWAERYVSQVRGWNTRLDEVQAAILRVKLRYLDEDNASRTRLARIYREGLKDLSLALPAVKEGCRHVHHLFVVRSGNRDEVVFNLHANNIGAGIHYPVPVHLQPAYSDFMSEGLAETEKAAKEVLSLPMYPGLTEEEAAVVVEGVREAVS